MTDDLKPFSYTIAADIHESTDEDFEELSEATRSFIIASSENIDNGKPKMLFVSAWIGHEGRNLNGDAFIKEELQQRVREGLFSPPYAGMIDYNHDFTARGYWYKANFAFDERSGQWGIFAKGAIWSWRYKELAALLTDECKKVGHINVSMSCLAETKEYTTIFPGATGEKTTIQHNPVFFTTSILSVPPGDAYAQGEVSDNKTEVNMAENDNKIIEGASITEIKVEGPETHALYKLAFPKTYWAKEEVTAFLVGEGYDGFTVQETGDRFEVELVPAETGTVLEETCISSIKSDCAIIAVVGSSSPGFAAQPEEARKKNNKMMMPEYARSAYTAFLFSSLISFRKNITETQTKISESEVKIASLTEEFNKITEAHESLKAELKAANDQLENIKTQEKIDAERTLLEARLAQLPESVRTNLEKHSDKDSIIALWKDLPEDKWKTTLSSFSLSELSKSYTERSEEEGKLPVGGGATANDIDLKSYLK